MTSLMTSQMTPSWSKSHRFTTVYRV